MTKVEVSHKTIIFTVFFLLGLYALFLIRDILLGVFIAILLMTALNPLVKKLEKMRLPRILSIWIVYILTLGVITGLIAAVVPPLISQTVGLLNYLPMAQIQDYVSTLEFSLQDFQVIANQLNSIPKVFGVVSTTFSVVLAVVTVMVMTFYLLVERDKLHQHLRWLFGDHDAEVKAQAFINKVEGQVGHWVRGQLTLMTIIGVVTYIGLLLLGIPYALPLAILAGILEILPNIGPTISAIPAVIVAYVTATPTMALIVAGLYIIIQQVENSLIVPKIMQSAVGINPLLTIILLLVGYRLGGVGGAALAIPIFLVVKVIATEFYLARISHRQPSPNNS